ncbi:hypothetical protein SAZ11_27275 [Streptomyces sp. FXJ1.4098]|uniref:hypothetical protein n=1 Tax=Streptomyces sp. NPDC020845 TaxID=3365096 RepID=UPI00299A9681|nr:hypothetical protein [Streptomyces sp. FXJ1.4098]
MGNRLEHNTLSGNAVDITHQPSARSPGQGNCLRGNALHRTLPLPEDLPRTARCPGGNSRFSAPAPRIRTASPPAGIAFLGVTPPPRRQSGRAVAVVR